MSLFEGLDFGRGGATGFPAVSRTLESLLESLSTTNERGLGLGVGLETDATLGSGASQRTGAEHSSDSCDVSFKSFNDVPLMPFYQRKQVK